MIFYKADDKLIQFNPETKVYKLRNTISNEDKRIAAEDFLLLNAKQIKRDEFSRLMNLYFKDIEHEWVYENRRYKKIANFEANNHSFSSNYNLGKDVPLHKIEGKEYFGNLVLVYHWGRVYYHTISYGGYPQGQLICPKTHNLVRWARLKNCSPIMNINTKKIV